jgi:hypothetical protein
VGIGLRDELEAIAPRVFREEASGRFNLLIFPSVHASSHQALLQGSKGGLVGQSEGGVRLLGGPKVALDADVDLLASALKPEPTAGCERRGLGQFLKAEELAEEPASFGLATGRRCELHVIDTPKRHAVR